MFCFYTQFFSLIHHLNLTSIPTTHCGTHASVFQSLLILPDALPSLLLCRSLCRPPSLPASAPLSHGGPPWRRRSRRAFTAGLHGGLPPSAASPPSLHPRTRQDPHLARRREPGEVRPPAPPQPGQEGRRMVRRLRMDDGRRIRDCWKFRGTEVMLNDRVCFREPRCS
jgi:hypothetical protein